MYAVAAVLDGDVACAHERVQRTARLRRADEIHHQVR